MDIFDVGRYVKIRQRAERPGTPSEGETARSALREMEEKYPGIAAAARRAERAVEAEEDTKPPPNPWVNVAETVLGRIASRATSRFADELSGHVSGANRFDPLANKHCKIIAHQCAPDQVCLEVRMNRAAVLRPRVLDQLLEAIETRLQREAGS